MAKQYLWEKKMNEWINLKEQKPKNFEKVLIALDNGSVVAGWRSQIGWDWEETDNQDDFDAGATHWMKWPNHPTMA